jgi:hypothetical protein
MKKVLIALLALVYLSFSVGMVLYGHYCMGELVSLSLAPSTDEACAKCGMQKHGAQSSACCQDVAVSAKVTDAHLQETVVEPLALTPLWLHPAPYAPTTPLVSAAMLAPLLTNHPPGKSSLLYLSFRNLRI